MNVRKEYKGSNFVKHGNYAVETHDDKFFKIYKNLDVYKDALFRYELAASWNSDIFNVPRMLESKICDNLGYIELEFIKYKEISLLDSIYFFYDVYQYIMQIEVLDPRLEKYEMQHEYMDLFKNNDMILAHGDLHYMNIIGNYVIDWDNLSYRPQKLEIATISFIYLSIVLARTNEFERAILNVRKLFGINALEDAYKLGMKKKLISVLPNKVKSFTQCCDKINEFIILHAN
jgi:hypothetical protein